jgi:hypothetical protein
VRSKADERCNVERNGRDREEFACTLGAGPEAPVPAPKPPPPSLFSVTASAANSVSRPTESPTRNAAAARSFTETVNSQ